MSLSFNRIVIATRAGVQLLLIWMITSILHIHFFEWHIIAPLYFKHSLLRELKKKFIWHRTRESGVAKIKNCKATVCDVKVKPNSGKIYFKSSRLAWLGRIFAEGSSPWKAYINYLLKHFWWTFLFSCNYDVKECKIISTFYRELLQLWADLRINKAIYIL